MKAPQSGFTQSPGYARARGVAGAFYIGFGVLIGYQILHGVGLRLEAVPGVALGAAMIALGVVRIRAALKTARPQ